MFCFNVKAKRHALGNAELAPDKYAKIKDALVEQIAEEILKNKTYGLDIFTIGSGKSATRV